MLTARLFRWLPRSQRWSDWAGTQNDLGAALAILGEREGGTAKLEEAIVAYREALKERTRDRVPLDWGRTSRATVRVRECRRRPGAAMGRGRCRCLGWRADVTLPLFCGPVSTCDPEHDQDDHCTEHIACIEPFEAPGVGPMLIEDGLCPG
jgi:hypothetical protein